MPALGAGEVSRVLVDEVPATPFRYSVDGRTYTWGLGTNQRMRGFVAADERFGYTDTVTRVELRRDDVADVAEGNPCGVFVQRLDDTGESLAADYPSDGSGTGECDMPELLASRIVNRGALDLFSNVLPDAKNIERADFVFDHGVLAPFVHGGRALAGHLVGEKRGNNPVRIAAILELDVFGQPAEYGPLIQIDAKHCAPERVCYGETDLVHEYSFFQNEMLVPQGFPSETERSVETVSMAFVDLQRLGLHAGQRYFGFSLFADDVDRNVHVLTDPATFPDDTSDPEISAGDDADVYGGLAGYFVAERLNVGSGRVYLDEDDDGAFGEGDAGIPDIGITLYADTNGDGAFDALVDEALSDSTDSDPRGLFQLPGLADGGYFVVLHEGDPDLPGGLDLVPGSNPHALFVSGGDVDGIDFPFSNGSGPAGGGADGGTGDGSTSGDGGADGDGTDDSGAGSADAGGADAGTGGDAGAGDAGADDSGAGNADAGGADAGTGGDGGAGDGAADGGGGDAGDGGAGDGGAGDGAVDGDGGTDDGGTDDGGTDDGGAADGGASDAGDAGDGGADGDGSGAGDGTGDGGTGEADAGGTGTGGTDAGGDAGGDDTGGADAGGEDAGAADGGAGDGTGAGAGDGAGTADGGATSGTTDGGTSGGGTTDGGAGDDGGDDGDQGAGDGGDAGTDTGGVIGRPDGDDSSTNAVADSASTDQGRAVSIDVLANDTDAVGDGLTIVAVSLSPDATVTLETAADGAQTVGYAPDFGFFGIDTFMYTIVDGDGTEATGTVTVSVGRYSDIDGNGFNDFVECDCTDLTLETGVNGSGIGRVSFATLAALAGASLLGAALRRRRTRVAGDRS